MTIRVGMSFRVMNYFLSCFEHDEYDGSMIIIDLMNHFHLAW